MKENNLLLGYTQYTNPIEISEESESLVGNVGLLSVTVTVSVSLSVSWSWSWSF